MAVSMIWKSEHLKKYFKTPRGMLHAVDDVNFHHRERARRWAWWASPAAASPPSGRTILGLHACHQRRGPL